MSKHVPAPVGLPIDGREQPTAEGWTYPARNPATGEVLRSEEHTSELQSH